VSLLIYTSVTVSTIVEGEKYVAPSQYRTTAVIATAACLIGAVLFLFYNEKKIMNDIESLKAGTAAEKKDS
jgi:hypothetical protein